MKINLRALSIAVSVAIGVLTLVQIAEPASLGISVVASRWVGIIAAGLGILAGFLPRVTGPTTDPDELAERIVGMAPAKRQKLQTAIERRLREPKRDPEPVFDAALGREARL